MKTPILIYGAGGLGKEVLSLIKAQGKFNAIGFLDDSLKANTIINGLKVLGDHTIFDSMRDRTNVVVAVGDPQVKQKIVEKIKNYNVEFPVIQHPSAILQDPDMIAIGPGTLITAGCILTTNIRIMDHVLINLKTTIGHDSTIGSCTSIMPGTNIAGGVTIGERVLIGSGVNIMNGRSIGSDSKVGMGAVVISDVPAGQTVVGVPAKPVQK